MSDSLQNITIKNATWTFLQRGGNLVIGFVGNLILTRLLSPDDYGCFGILFVFISLADILVEGGFGTALIQKKSIDERDCSTVFVVNLALSILLFSVLYFTSPYIARYFSLPLLELVLKVDGISLLIRSLYLVPLAILTRKLKFKVLSVINIFSSLISITFAILFAYNNFGVWSLVVKGLSLQCSLCLLCIVFSRYKFSFAFSLRAFKRMFNFGGMLLISDILDKVFENIQSFIIGKKFRIDTLGYYQQALSLGQVPIYSLSMVSNQVLFPTLSKFQEDHNLLLRGARKSIKMISFISFPVILLFILLAKPLIIILYTEKWLDAVPFLQYICLLGLFNASYHTNRTILKSLGKSRLLFFAEIFYVFVSLLFMILGLKFGIWFFLFGKFIGFLFCWLFLLYLNGRVINYGIWNQLKDMAPTFLLAMFATFLTHIVDVTFVFNNYITIVILILCYFSTYCVLSAIFKIEGFEILKSFIYCRK